MGIALEDAVLFGTLFARLSSWRQLPSFLSAYQELREERCAIVKATELKEARLVALPPGPARDARDAAYAKASTDEWDDEMMRAIFEGTAYVFGYVASDEADEWWIDWGRYAEAAGGEDGGQAKHMSLSPQALSMLSQITREETYEE